MPTSLKSLFSIERLVAVLTPVFGAVSGWIVGIVANNVPGAPAIHAGDITALQIAGFTGAVAAALKWLHGRQKYVALTDDAKKFFTEAVGKLEKAQADLASNPETAAAVNDLKQLFKEHASQIETTFDEKLPKAVAQSLQTLFAGLGQVQAAAVAAAVPPPPPPTSIDVSAPAPIQSA